VIAVAAARAVANRRWERPLPIAAVHVVQDDRIDDWILRDPCGDELGHFPTRESAETAGRLLAQKLHGELVVHLFDGSTTRKSFA
jgi:hypothetical protein